MRRFTKAALAFAFGAIGMTACSTDTTRTPQATFIGSAKCQSCHGEQYASWQNSWHAKMVRPAKTALLKDAADNWEKDSKGTAGPAKANITGTTVKMADVVYVIGSKWKQRYLVPNPQTGGHQFLDKQWNTIHKQWEPYGQKNTWESQCATCHTTGYRVLAVDEKTRAVTKWAMTEENVGCESCHGPGSAHASSGDRREIFNPGKASIAEQSKVCGYCHIRVENYNFKTAEGNPAEQLPHPTLGQSYRAGSDDWTRWYPDKVLLVGIQEANPVNKNYPNTDLNNAFWIDEAAQKSGFFEARKHHQEYQEYLMSAHAKKNVASCSTCHSSHASKTRPAKKAADSCKSCHGDTAYDLDKVMPGTGQTALNLFIRTHTFNPNSPRKGGPTVPAGAPEPAYRN